MLVLYKVAQLEGGDVSMWWVIRLKLMLAWVVCVYIYIYIYIWQGQNENLILKQAYWASSLSLLRIKVLYSQQKKKKTS